MAFEPTVDKIVWAPFEFVIDIIFITDIVIVFRTSMISPHTGDEITDPKLIAKKYMCSTRFPLDVLAATPFDFILWIAGVDEGILTALGFIKITRILRLNKIITFMQAKEEVKGTVRLIQCLLLLVLYVHFTACGWFRIVRMD